MDAIESLQRRYHDGGFRNITLGVWQHLLRRTKVASITESIVGPVLVEKLVMRPQVGYWPQIRKPRSFNEKIMNRKLCTNESRFSILANKAEVREYVRETVGPTILNEIYHTTANPDTIQFDELPNEFVIKSTHASGHVILIDDKSKADITAIRNECRNWLCQEFGVDKKEYWYGDVKPQIIVENYLHDEEHGVPPDFKFFVFHGSVEYIQVDYDRFSNHTRRFYTPDWEPLEFELEFPLGPIIDQPAQLDAMIDVAEQLGEGFDFLRVDLYQPNGDEVVFGEITPAPGNGGERFRPVTYDFSLGSLW